MMSIRKRTAAVGAVVAMIAAAGPVAGASAAAFPLASPALPALPASPYSGAYQAGADAAIGGWTAGATAAAGGFNAGAAALGLPASFAVQPGFGGLPTVGIAGFGLPLAP
jgi:hypothetical protein